MKRGSGVLQPPCVSSKRHTHTANTHTPDTHAACSSPFPAATSLFSPDVSTKTASDLLIRLSEATQKAQVHPGSRAGAEAQSEAVPAGRGGQQDEPGLALSPDGPGASPEPPTLTHTLTHTHTPDNTAATDTLASDLLRKLAERQEVNSHGVRVKEEEEPMEVDTVTTSDLANGGPITEETASSTAKNASQHLLTVKTEEQSLSGAKMADQRPLGLKVVDKFYTGGRQPGAKMADSVLSGANMANQFQFRVKMEDHCVSGAKMEDQLLSEAKIPGQPFSGAKMEDQLLPRAKIEDQIFSQAKMVDQLLFGAKMSDQLFSGAKVKDRLFFGAKMEDHLPSGAKMADQCLRAVLWQDMSVNLASTLLHQLSERVSKSSSQQVDRTAPPSRSSPCVLKVNTDPPCSSPALSPQEPAHEVQTSLSSDQTTGCSYFYRCHVCGFETEGRGLFQGHMMEHRQWERGSFSLHCCMCDHSTNQEAEMRVHVDTHIPGDTGIAGETRCPVNPPTAATASSPAVAMATQPEQSIAEHRCRICQRSFPGQQELLVHFQGHRQGNQYRCDRCGHLTRTANKLVEHVRVHTGERPFTCDLCPYSAKRRDSLRLHCKVKHPAHVARDAPGDVHTHRSYVHGDNQRWYKQGSGERLHTPLSSSSSSSSSSSLHPFVSERAGWRDLSPLLPITTLLSLKPPAPSSSSPSPPSPSSSSLQHSFLSYLGLTGSS